MAYRSFSHFIDELGQRSELVRIAEPVATELEITDLADRQMKAPGGGKALLFEKPTIEGKISPFPVAINTMGSERRMACALGLESIDEIAHQMQLILKAKPPTSIRQGIKGIDGAAELLGVKPTTLSSRIEKLGLKRPSGHDPQEREMSARKWSQETAMGISDAPLRR